MARVLVVDDDPHIRELLRRLLGKEGFDVLEAADGAEALRRFESAKVDLVVLDLMMPTMDGWELCRRLQEDAEVPVLMVSAKGEVADRVKGFQSGTDDYLPKPFDPRELVARVRALLKRYRVTASQSVKVGSLNLDRDARAAVSDGRVLDLPPREFDLLFDLACNAGRTRLRDSLIEDLWGTDFDGNERTLDVHINRLRERLQDPAFGVRIRTIRGLGYRLEAGE